MENSRQPLDRPPNRAASIEDRAVPADSGGAAAAQETVVDAPPAVPAAGTAPAVPGPGGEWTGDSWEGAAARGAASRATQRGWES